MAREYAAVRHAILADPQWRNLSMQAQHLYLVLLVHPGLSYAGVLDWRPNRLRPYAKDWSEHDFYLGAVDLSDAGWIVIDDITEEVMIRSFLRHDRVLEQKHLSVSMINAYNGVSSPHIRAAIIHELGRLHHERPELKCWDDHRMLEILGHDAVDGRDFARHYNPPAGLLLAHPSGP